MAVGDGPLLLIHGKWYDTSSFDHPGGPLLLERCRNRDATALFEMHHAMSNRKHMLNVLSKLEVPADQAKSLLPVDDRQETHWDWAAQGGVMLPNSKFRTDLVARVRAYFQEEAKRRGVSMAQAIKPPAWWWLRHLLVILVAVFLVGPSYVRGSWWTVPVMPVLAWVVSGALMHDGSHFGLSTDWRVNWIGSMCAPWLASSETWFVQHAVGHHAHTNHEEFDPDLAHAPQNWRYHPSVPHVKAHRLQWLVFPIIWSVATVSTAFENELRGFLSQSHLYNEATVMTHTRLQGYKRGLIGRIAVISAIFGFFTWPLFTMPLRKALIWPLMTWSGMSLLFMMFSQVSHLDRICLTSKSTDWFKHQAVVAADFSCQSWFWNWMSIGLNNQVAHHLFCTISPAHYPAIQPIIRQVCLEHEVPYRCVGHGAFGYWHAFRGYVATLWALSREDPASKVEFTVVDKKGGTVTRSTTQSSNVLERPWIHATQDQTTTAKKLQ